MAGKLCDMGKPLGVDPVTRKSPKVRPSTVGCRGELHPFKSADGRNQINVCKGHLVDFQFCKNMLLNDDLNV